MTKQLVNPTPEEVKFIKHNWHVLGLPTKVITIECNYASGNLSINDLKFKIDQRYVDWMDKHFSRRWCNVGMYGCEVYCESIEDVVLYQLTHGNNNYGIL